MDEFRITLLISKLFHKKQTTVTKIKKFNNYEMFMFFMITNCFYQEPNDRSTCNYNN